MRPHFAVEKSYLRFVLVTITSVTTLCAVLSVAVLYIMDIDSDAGNGGYAFFFQSFLTTTVGTSSMVLVTGSFSFFVRINAKSIKVWFPANEIKWQDIKTIKIVGIPRIKSLNELIIMDQQGQLLKVKLFVFKDQNAFIKELIGYVPWASGLSTDNLPSEVTRTG